MAQPPNPSANGQGNAPAEITIRRASNAIDDAVRIVGFRLDGHYYDLENARVSPSIRATPGWLERVEIVVKNISPKIMVAGTIQVECPSINHGPREQFIYDQFTLGIVPDRFRSPSGAPLASRATTRPPISVSPGQEGTFVLGNDFERMRKKIQPGGPFPDCTVWPIVFHFSDGTYWERRQFFKPDPNSTSGYVRITPEEFGISSKAQ